MLRPPPRSTRTDTLFPYTTLFRSSGTRPGCWLSSPNTDERVWMPKTVCHGSEPMSDWQPSATFDALRLRARLNAAVREFFAQRGVLEVETPVMSQAGNTEPNRSEEHTSELQSLMRNSYDAICLKKK